MSAPIALITDSTCDIPLPLREQYPFAVVPLTIIWDGQAYLDGVEMTPEAFYRRLEQDPAHPTTSQPSPQAFLAAVQAAQQAGAGEAVIITMSSAMSGTYESARQAAAQANIPVHVYDSKTNSMGLGWQVLAAARARDTGGDVADILAAASRVSKRVQLYITLDTLDYVARGGRIGNASRMVGAMLNIKPVIYVDPQTGLVEPSGMAMTRHKAVDMLYHKFFSLMDGQGSTHVAVLHGDAAEEAATLYERVAREQAPAEMLTNITGPVLGINTGPQALALCGYSE